MRESRVSVVFMALLLGIAAIGLAAAGDAVITGRVTNEIDGSPVANATVSIAELGLSASTDRTGRYSLTVPAASVTGQSVELRVVGPNI